MKLTKLELENFRNYPKYKYDFPADKEVIVLVGPNGIGKTNLLEAIYLLSLGKSFRSLLQDDLVHWDNEFLRCTAHAEIDDESCHLEVFYSTKPIRRKNFKKNGVNLKNSEYLGNLLTVLFHPEDLNMLYLQPSLRRRYMDIVLSQTDKSYLLSLTNYKKALKQRNALLGQIREAHFDGASESALQEDLAAWDEEIVQYGAPLIAKRLEFTAFLNEKIEKIYHKISGEKERISIEYVSKIVTPTLYSDTLLARRRQDTFKAETSAGPHRDDLAFFLNGKNICTSASRGEFRTLLLALKLAEIDFIKARTGKNPILLLDDVFSELDHRRQTHLLKSIKGCQTIITTCDTASLEDLSENKAVLQIEL
ncbi:DNA replication/repair protein RecF [Candidatus Peregrinibacteria bacterium]|nr:DNA replication/repair protein RecF [Candidatus Peregrinibacteria bacterium]